MNKTTAVSLQNISKVYKLYDKPIDRLKESLHPFKKKYHKDFYALKNINLEIKKGEVLGIVGVNGAGKSTLLKIISEVLTPSSGRVNIHGRINAILELGSSLKPEMTGRENIKLNLQINGIEKDREKITDEIIEFADIGEHIDQPIKSYSSGMKARLGFGIATSTDPDVLIVDEVLAVGDVLFQRKCYSRIEKLFKDGKTVIFVSHSAQSVVEFCSRAVLLYDREIIMDDTPKKVTDYYQKLVFSKDKRKVLDEINGKVEVKKEEEKQEIKKDIEVDKEFYLDALKLKKSQIINADVLITDVCLLNEYNRKVNILKHNDRYKLIYKVIFKETCRNVKFGHYIKNLQGKWISGTTIPSRYKCIEHINSNSEYIISSEFIANLTVGVKRSTEVVSF
jgi:lipopolysaccharide transport system ATP-binding protein